MTRKQLFGTLLPICLLLLAGSSILAQSAEYDIARLKAASAGEVKARADRGIHLKVGALSKLGPHLAELSMDYRSHLRQRALGVGAKAFKSSNPLIRLDNERIWIEAVAENDSGALLADLQALGLESPSRWGRLVSGSLPVASLDQAARLSALRFAQVPAATTRTGSVTSQGDAAMGSDRLRAVKGVDGAGTTVGVLSDAYDCLGGAAAGVASGDLPAGVIVLDDLTGPDCAGAIDEGRAMIEIVHDVAPGAAAAFHTAFRSQADFANGILELFTQAGAEVIVDDIIYFAEPMFQDGAIAQAADKVKANGAAYFSAAGNNARDAYQQRYRNSGVVGAFGGVRHDFDPGPGVDDLQTVTLGTGTTIFSFQWSEPFFSVSGPPGSASDMDILIYTAGGAFTGIAGAANNIGGDSVEVFGITNSGPPVQVQIGLELFAGPAPAFMKYVFFGPMTVNEFDTASGTVYGHAAANGAEAVGAAFYQDTPAFGQNPPLIEPFSSAGFAFVFFDTQGNPFRQRRAKPEIVGPDGVNTTFFPPPPLNPNDVEMDGFPNFFGTSAAAPHAAAVAALLLEINPSLSPDDIYKALEKTAIDMDDPFTPGFDTGFDNGTGYGFINALRAGMAVMP